MNGNNDPKVHVYWSTGTNSPNCNVYLENGDTTERWPVNTAKECTEAQERMRELGIQSAKVFVGDLGDFANGQILIA